MTAAGEPLAGRAAAQAALDAAVDAAAAGRGRLVLVTGEAGIGKTTAARDMLDHAARAGARTVWTACWPDEGVEHGPWRTILGELGPDAVAAAHALAAPGDGDPAAAAAARAAAYETALGALAVSAREQTLVIVVDDLHWADDGTLRLLAALRGRLPSLPLLVVGTYRDDEVPAGAALADVATLADRVALTPLGPADIVSVLEDVLGASPTDTVVHDVVRRTGGNPFLVVQVARLLAAGADDTLPAGARDVLHRRLAVLDDDVRRVLEAAAVVGGSFTAAFLARLTRDTTDDVVDVLHRAASARVVTPASAPNEWMFVHDLFRVATLDRIAPSDAVALHRSAADLLIDDGAEPAAIAHHLLVAASGPDDAAAAWSLRAADAALHLMAWEAAGAHAERALAVLPSGGASDGLRGEAWLLLGRARLLCGETESAVAAFTTAAALARALGSVDLLARAALGFAADLGGFEVRLFDQRQIDLLEEAAAALSRAESPALRARVLARLSVALSFAAPTERRLALAEQAVALARGVGDPVVLAGALAAHCDAISGPADVERRLLESSETIGLAERAGEGGLELLGRRIRFVALLESGEVAAAIEEMNAFARRAAEVGNPLYSWYVPLWRGMWALARGDLEEAERSGAEAAAVGRRAGSSNAPMLEAVLRAERLIQSDERDLLESIFDDIRVVMGELFDSPQSVGNMARIYFDLGRDTEARAYLDRFHRLGIGGLPVDAEWLPGIVATIAAAIALEHPMLDQLVDAAAPFAHLCAFEGIGAVAHGSVARFVARGCTALGRHEEAVSLARRALAVDRSIGALVAAHSERTLADALDAASPGGDEAARLHERADRAFASLGLRHLVRAATSAPVAQPTADSDASEGIDGAVLRRDGDVWHVSYAGRSTIVKHSKGVADLAVLLARPGREVHVTELETLPREAVHAATAGARDEAIDRRAIAAYRARLHELDEELVDAEDAHDLARAERARTERDFLVDELSASVGLGGRSRAAGPDPVERLRKAVTARVRDAIRRIDAVHPALGRHLANSVRTGAFCSYRPEQPTIWQCET